MRAVLAQLFAKGRKCGVKGSGLDVQPLMMVYFTRKLK